MVLRVIDESWLRSGEGVPGAAVFFLKDDDVRGVCTFNGENGGLVIGDFNGEIVAD